MKCCRSDRLNEEKMKASREKAASRIAPRCLPLPSWRDGWYCSPTRELWEGSNTRKEKIMLSDVKYWWMAWTFWEVKTRKKHTCACTHARRHACTIWFQEETRALTSHSWKCHPLLHHYGLYLLVPELESVSIIYLISTRKSFSAGRYQKEVRHLRSEDGPTHHPGNN